MPGNKRWDARRDANEPEIVRTYEALGYLVCRDLRVDLLVIGQGDIFLVEVKTPTGKLKGQQIKFIADCQARGVVVPVARTIEEALRAVGRL